MVLVQRAKGITAAQQSRLQSVGTPTARRISTTSGRTTVGKLGLTGEDIAKLSAAGTVTSRKIEELARKKKFRSTYITRSGTAESTLKARTLQQIRSGSIRTPGGFSVIEGVLVASKDAPRIVNVINEERKRQYLQSEKERMQAEARAFLARKQSVPDNLRQQIQQVKQQSDFIIPERLQKNIEIMEARKQKLLQDIKKQSEARRISYINKPNAKVPKRLTLKGLKTEAELFTLGFIRGIVNTGIAVKNPRATVKTFAEQFNNKNIGNTINSIKQDIKKDPLGALGEFTSTALLFKAFGKILKPVTNSLKVISKEKLPGAKFFEFNETGTFKTKTKLVKYIKSAKINTKTGEGIAKVKLLNNRTGNVIKSLKEKIKITPLEKERIKLRLEAKKAKKISKGLQVKAAQKEYIFTDIQTGKTRIFESSKQFRKAVKAQEKFLKTSAGKKLLKIQRKIQNAKTRKAKLKLEKERIRLRLEAKKAKKISKGLQVKSERKLPTNKGYAFEDNVTGEIRYFKSRKDFLRAIKQQLKSEKARKVNLGLFFDNKNLVEIGLEDRVIIFNLKGQKIIEIFKKSKKIKPINIPKTIPKVTKKKFNINKFRRLPKVKFKEVQKGKQILLVKQKLKPRRIKKLKIKSKLKSKLKQKIATKTRIVKKQKLKLKTKVIKKLIQKQKQKLLLGIKSLVKQKQKQLQKQLQQPQLKLDQKQKQAQKQELKLAQSLKLQQRILQKPKLKTKQKTRTKQKQQQLQKQKLKLVLKLKQIKQQKRKLILRDKKIEEKIKKAYALQMKSRRFIFSPDLFAKLTGAKATPTERKRLLRIGRQFTGLEIRKIV